MPDCLGFDAEGKVTNYMSAGIRSMSVQEIVTASTKLLTLVDLAGHEKYLRTTGTVCVFAGTVVPEPMCQRPAGNSLSSVHVLQCLV